MAYNEEFPMKAIKQRLKSKAYWLNLLGGPVLAYVAATPATFGITGPAGLAVLAIANIVVREMTTKPISEK